MSEVVLERVIKRKITTWIKKVVENNKQATYWMPAGNLFSSSLPDYMLLYRGLLICIEAKSSIGKPTILQSKMAEKLRAAGAIYFVVSNDEELENVKQYVSRAGSSESN
jgi:hypothetical protein